MTWEDITIDKYRDIVKIDTDGVDNITVAIKMLSVLKGMPEEFYLGMSVTELGAAVAELSFLNEECKPRIPKSDKYLVNGKPYRLTMNAGKMMAGQFIDYTTLLKEDPDNHAMLMAVILVPEGRKYGEGYDIQELAEEFGACFKWVDVMGISFFFRLALEIYSRTTLISSVRTLRKELKKEKDPRKRMAIRESIAAIQQSGLG